MRMILKGYICTRTEKKQNYQVSRKVKSELGLGNLSRDNLLPQLHLSVSSFSASLCPLCPFILLYTFSSCMQPLQTTPISVKIF